MSDDRATIRGLLIEGTDYAGKTTTSKIIHARLQESGVDSRFAQCYLSGSPIVAFLEAAAKAVDGLEARDWYYSAAILTDLQLIGRGPLEGFRVQDRHWFSQLTRNAFFHPDTVFMPKRHLESQHRPFEINVYLTSSVEAKIERARSRPPKSPRDQLLRDDPTLHQRFDEYSIGLLPENETWYVVDTTGKQPDEVADSVMELISVADKSA